jgi:hypothetical protein
LIKQSSWWTHIFLFFPSRTEAEETIYQTESIAQLCEQNLTCTSICQAITQDANHRLKIPLILCTKRSRTTQISPSPSHNHFLLKHHTRIIFDFSCWVPHINLHFRLHRPNLTLFDFFFPFRFTTAAHLLLFSQNLHKLTELTPIKS